MGYVPPPPPPSTALRDLTDAILQGLDARLTEVEGLLADAADWALDGPTPVPLALAGRLMRFRSEFRARPVVTTTRHYPRPCGAAPRTHGAGWVSG